MTSSRRIKSGHYRLGLLVFLVILSTSTYADSSTFSDLFINLNESLDEVWQMLIATCYLVGFSLTVGAIYKLKKFGERTCLYA